MKKDFEELISFAIKAPSGHNTQPWLFRADEDSIYIFPDYRRTLPIADPDNQELFMSIGCALENLVIAAQHSGYEPIVQILNGVDASPYIRVALVVRTITPNEALFNQIEVRQTTRNKYNGEPIPAHHLRLLQEVAGDDNVQCILITDSGKMEAIAALVKEAVTVHLNNKAYVDELVHWIRFNKARAVATHDGLYSATTGNPLVPDWFGRWMMNKNLSEHKEAQKHEQLIKSSSALAVFVAKQNNTTGWISTGRSFERFALMATALNINHAHENMACEEPFIKSKLGGLLDIQAAEQPMLLVRLGYSEKMPYSYRRPLHEVILDKQKHIEMNLV